MKAVTSLFKRLIDTLKESVKHIQNPVKSRPSCRLSYKTYDFLQNALGFPERLVDCDKNDRICRR
jgi:hypothetical protein